MADDLKRVGLVFKQDGAVDFKKTLQEVNIELNKNYNQFKLTQAQWDSSTKSTEKLRAEQEYLRNAYEIQSDKVNTLRMQLSDLENAEDKNTTVIKKKRNELTSAEIKLESYNKRIKEIESQLHNTGKRIEEFGETCSDSMDFETKFATSPLNKEYTDLFTEVATNCKYILPPVVETEGKSNKQQVVEEVLSDAKYIAKDLTMPARRKAREAFDSKMRDTPLGKIEQASNTMWVVKRLFGKKDKNDDE